MQSQEKFPNQGQDRLEEEFSQEKETVQKVADRNAAEKQPASKEQQKENKAAKKTKEAEKQPDYQDKYLRSLAEMENLRKRLQKEKLESMRFMVENTISEFLPVLDNFENALKFATTSSEEVKKWASGFQMIINQFKDVLYNHGIVAFHSEGNHFDPYLHEAMEIVETNNHLDGTILEEFAKGYKSEKRVIKPAKVKVAKKPVAKEDNHKKEDLQTKNQG